MNLTDARILNIISAQLDGNGQLDIIKLTLPKKAIPGSVGAVIYLTGE